MEKTVSKKINGFILFKTENRQKVVTEFIEDIQYLSKKDTSKEVNRILLQTWKNMSTDSKRDFKHRAKFINYELKNNKSKKYGKITDYFYVTA